MTRLFRDHEETFPPKLTCWNMVGLWISSLSIAAALLLAVNQMFSPTPRIAPSCTCWAYVSFAVLLAGLFFDRFLRHKSVFHRARREDRSEVEALIVEARNVEPRDARIEGYRSFHPLGSRRRFLL